MECFTSNQLRSPNLLNQESAELNPFCGTVFYLILILILIIVLIIFCTPVTPVCVPLMLDYDFRLPICVGMPSVYTIAIH